VRQRAARRSLRRVLAFRRGATPQAGAGTLGQIRPADALREELKDKKILPEKLAQPENATYVFGDVSDLCFIAHRNSQEAKHFLAILDNGKPVVRRGRKAMGS